MTRRPTKLTLRYPGATPLRWIRVAVEAIDDGLAGLCAQQWRSAQTVRVEAPPGTRFRGKFEARHPY